MKKRIISLLVVGTMLTSLVGCAQSGTNTQASAQNNEQTTQQTNENVTVKTESVNQQQLVEDALEPEVWIEHVEEDLMKFWGNTDAQDMSDGLFNTYLTNSGEIFSTDSENLPEEIKAALENEATSGWIDTDNNYVRAHSRLTYAYGIAYHMTGKTEYLEMCKKGALILQDLVDDEGGMCVVKNKETGEWDSDKNARTSQDLAYGITGMGMYYFLTHDESMLESIIKVKNYIFDTYYDEDKGYITWYPKDVADNQTQLVAQLDQLYAYMIMLTPSLPEPYQSEWKADMKKVADIMINRFYSEKNNLFWGVINDNESMMLGTDHTDFGHSVKTLWVILKVGQITGDTFYVEFAKPKIAAILADAYVEENGSWSRRFNSDGTRDETKEWWICAELDQAAEILSINDPTYYEYLNNTQKYWLETMVDHENGEIWHMLDADGNPIISYPKVHCWKTSLHSFEHALFSYMAAAQLKGSDFELYYAFSENEEVTESSVQLYMFSANATNISKGEKIADMTDGNCIYKVQFNQLY